MVFVYLQEQLFTFNELLQHYLECTHRASNQYRLQQCVPLPYTTTMRHGVITLELHTCNVVKKITYTSRATGMDC